MNLIQILILIVIVIIAIFVIIAVVLYSDPEKEDKEAMEYDEFLQKLRDPYF